MATSRIERRDGDTARAVEQSPGDHASTARPLSAKSPRGRFWMNRMMKTSTRILPEHGAGEGFEELVGDAERHRRDQRAPQIADAAEDDHHEAVDDVGLAEIGADIVDLAQRHAGYPGNAGAKSEGERIDTRRVDAHGARHFAVLRHGAHLQAEARVAHRQQQAEEDGKREQDDDDAVEGQRNLADLERARHPGRRADFAIGRTEDRADGLLQDERQAPGGEQRFERPAIEEADDAALDADADHAGQSKGERQRDEQRIVEKARRRSCG